MCKDSYSYDFKPSGDTWSQREDGAVCTCTIVLRSSLVRPREPRATLQLHVRVAVCGVLRHGTLPREVAIMQYRATWGKDVQLVQAARFTCPQLNAKAPG